MSCFYDVWIIFLVTGPLLRNFQGETEEESPVCKSSNSVESLVDDSGESCLNLFK